VIPERIIFVSRGITVHVNPACRSSICSLGLFLVWMQKPKCDREVHLVFPFPAGMPDLPCTPTDKNLGG